jgi:predicted peptidase
MRDVKRPCFTDLSSLVTLGYALFMRCASLIPVAFVLFMIQPLFAHDPGNDAATTAKFEARTHTSDNGGSLPYRLFKPSGLEHDKKYPLLVFLHGAGERGTDNESQLKWGGKVLAEAVQAKEKCFVVAPQCPPEHQWVNTPWAKGSYSVDAVKESDELRMVVEIVKKVSKEFPIDADRIYVMGLSMGGFATWDLITRHPDLFTAAVPICGGGDPSKAKEIRAKVWAFHGGADDVVPTAGTREMIEALKRAKKDPKYTEYAGVGHASWVNAWNEKGLIEWLMGQRREEK